MAEEAPISAIADARAIALRHIGLLLATLYAIKLALLQFDRSWTYAGPISLLASFAVASWCLRSAGENWAGLGLRPPPNFPKMLGWAIIVMVVTTIAGGIFESAMASAFGGNGSAIDPRYQNRFADVPGNVPLYLYWLAVAWTVGGFTEEMLFRAMLISRFERILGKARFATPIAIVIQSVIFGQQHYYYQGWSGAVANGATALISGIFYVVLKRNLWPLVISHGLANTLGLTLIFAGMQTEN